MISIWILTWMLLSFDSFVLIIINELYCHSFSVLLIFYMIITYTNLFSVCSCKWPLMTTSLPIFYKFCGLILLMTKCWHIVNSPLALSIAHQIHFGVLSVLRFWYVLFLSIVILESLCSILIAHFFWECRSFSSFLCLIHSSMPGLYLLALLDS